MNNILQVLHRHCRGSCSWDRSHIHVSISWLVSVLLSTADFSLNKYEWIKAKGHGLASSIDYLLPYLKLLLGLHRLRICWPAKTQTVPGPMPDTLATSLQSWCSQHLPSVYCQDCSSARHAMLRSNNTTYLLCILAVCRLFPYLKYLITGQ